MVGQRVANWASLGALVKSARAEQGLTQTGLAAKAGVSRAWLAKFESGHRGAEFEQILCALNALDIALIARTNEHDEPDASLRQVLALKRSQREIEERLRALRDDSASWSLPDEHWSLPGQQEKFALVRRNDRWFSATGSAATTHIIKPGIGRMHHQALVEYATMRAAGQVGLDIAHVDFTHFGNEPAIVVERFGRVEVDGEVVRVHQEDFCQAAGRMPNCKYETHDGPGLDDGAHHRRAQQQPDRGQVGHR